MRTFSRSPFALFKPFTPRFHTFFHTLLSHFVFTLVFFTSPPLHAAEPAAPNTPLPRQIVVPPGYKIEFVAGPPLVNRPITCDFDEQGRLYVADSSGSNEPVAVQAQKLPHRIVRLEDTDGDGRFDKSTVFADKMMFPEGAMWYDGSLYVGAPPHIWKLTDADGDGVAEKREQWFVGQTLGGCANDMHGPYLGPDGWIYWCKGEFAQATYEQFKGPPLVTRAAHIFRRRPEGGLVEPVLTGGMNNPVEVAFSASGERFLSGTFFETPAYLKRDGLIHSIYGGVYGKPDNSVHGFPRTGPLMPTMTQMGAAAACGLACLETNGLGPGFAGNLLACQFNMHKVSRHVLVPHEATFTTKDQNFVTSPDVDFHPTDVIEDADGSVLVIDTGGWYKVCCPTSQLHKPDILGGIYRISRIDAHPPADPRGAKLDWTHFDSGKLTALLADERPRCGGEQAMLAKLGAAAIEPLTQILKTSPSPVARCMAVWTLTRIPLLAARVAIHPALADADEQVRQAAGNSAAAWRDAGATEGLLAMLSKNNVPNRRVAAEAIGRIGNAATVPAILAAAAEGLGQSLEHSLVYALIELDDPAATRVGLTAKSPFTRRAALIALDQMPHRSLKMDEVSPLLASADAPLRDAAWWIVERHPDWSGAVVPQFRSEVFDRKITPAATAMLLDRLRKFGGQQAVRQIIAEGLTGADVAPPVKEALLTVISESGARQLSPAWNAAMLAVISSPDKKLAAHGVNALHRLSGLQPSAELKTRLLELAADNGVSNLVRLQALAMVRLQGQGRSHAPVRAPLDAKPFKLALEGLSLEQPLTVRLLAADLLFAAQLTDPQRKELCTALAIAGPMELRRLLPTFKESNDPQLGEQLVTMLDQHAAITSLEPAVVQQALAGFGPTVAKPAAKVFERIEAANRDKVKRIDTLVEPARHGDRSRGHQVFFSTKASCSACHTVGYVGGNVGPILSDIGRIRSERDLLESILYPSASIARTFEPVMITTTAGKPFTGIVREENDAEIVLVVDAQTVVRIPKDEIAERADAKKSIMPEGLDKVLTPQELADLVAFLKAAQ